MPIIDPNLSKLSPDHRQQLVARLAEFDRTWDEGRLAACVRELPAAGPLRRLILLGMIKVDLEKQWQRGRRPVVEAYLHFYPELGTRDTAPLELIEAECEARRRHGAPADMAALAKRFPRQGEVLRARAEGAARSAPEARTAEHHETVPLPPLTAASPAPRAGQDVAEQLRYRILRKLGEGGMGAVYLAHDTQMDRRVALKIPRLSAEDSTLTLERFYREARAAATIEHPSICPVYDVGAVNGVNYLTMAYIDGEQLSGLVGRDRPLPQPQAAALVRQLALALQEAHRGGIIHRDLKPSNIMLKSTQVPVIMDFGLARRLNHADARLTVSGALLGTPAYMSPEQVAGETEAQGTGCDIYSLGVILYELLTGRVPFEGSIGAILSRILTQAPARPSTLRPDLDPRLEALCLKALAKRVEDRPRTMGEFAAALDGYLQGARQTSEAVGAAPGPPPRAPAPAAAAPSAPSRHPPPSGTRGGAGGSKIWWLLGAAAAGVVVLVVCLLLALKGGG